jgi:hypothetical protein
MRDTKIQDFFPKFGQSQRMLKSNKHTEIVGEVLEMKIEWVIQE